MLRSAVSQVALTQSVRVEAVSLSVIVSLKQSGDPSLFLLSSHWTEKVLGLRAFVLGQPLLSMPRCAPRIRQKTRTCAPLQRPPSTGANSSRIATPVLSYTLHRTNGITLGFRPGWMCRRVCLWQRQMWVFEDMSIQTSVLPMNQKNRILLTGSTRDGESPRDSPRSVPVLQPHHKPSDSKDEWVS